MREELWFLSAFWVRPGLQGKSIGGPLLDRAMAEGRRRGVSIFFTWSSLDRTAMAIYMRRGLLPGTPIMTFVGPSNSLSIDLPVGVEVAPLVAQHAIEIDAEVRAVRREIDHAHLATTSSGREVRRSGQVIGYFYAKGGVVVRPPGASQTTQPRF